MGGSAGIGGAKGGAEGGVAEGCAEGGGAEGCGGDRGGGERRIGWGEGGRSACGDKGGAMGGNAEGSAVSGGTEGGGGDRGGGEVSEGRGGGGCSAGGVERGAKGGSAEGVAMGGGIGHCAIALPSPRWAMSLEISEYVELCSGALRSESTPATGTPAVMMRSRAMHFALQPSGTVCVPSEVVVCLALPLC